MSDWQADLAARETEWGADHPVRIEFQRFTNTRRARRRAMIGTWIAEAVGAVAVALTIYFLVCA